MLVGDLVYTGLAIRLMRRTGRDDVTAMPFGIDTPSLFGIVFGVLGPVMLLTHEKYRQFTTKKIADARTTSRRAM